jgi:hypothetical protein
MQRKIGGMINMKERLLYMADVKIPNSIQFTCKCGKFKTITFEGLYTEPCPNCGREYIGMSIGAVELKSHVISKHKISNSGWKRVDQLPEQNLIEVYQNNRPTAHEKDIMFNCIDKSLCLLSSMFYEHKNMPAEKVVVITNAIEKLLAIRKQFLRDYFIPPRPALNIIPENETKHANKEATHD